MNSCELFLHRQKCHVPYSNQLSRHRTFFFSFFTEPFFPKLYFMRMNYVQHTLNATHINSRTMFEPFFFLSSFSLIWWLFFFGQKFSLHFAVALHFYMDLALCFFLWYVASNSRDGNTLWAIMFATCTDEKYKRKAANNNNAATIKRNKSFSCFESYFFFTFHVSHTELRVSGGLMATKTMTSTTNGTYFTLFHSRSDFHLK